MTLPLEKKTTLRDRCEEFYHQLGRKALLRQGSPVDDIMEFVLAERGRSADPSLDQSLPLVLYFVTDEDRDEFIAIVRAAKPGMRTRKLP